MDRCRTKGAVTPIAMSDGGRFDVMAQGGAVVIEVIGDFDINNVGQFNVALESALAFGRQTIIVSLARAAYFDSIAIRSLLRSEERLAITRRRLCIVASKNTLPRRILEIAGVPHRGGIFDHVEDALATSEAS
jgi:anti-anti-sigma factor